MNKRIEINEEFICEYVDDTNMIVFEYMTFKKYFGTIKDNILHLTDEYSKEQSKDIEILLSVEKPERVSVIEFMKLIKYQPKYPVLEPYDKLGLTVCEFMDNNKLSPTIEFDIDGGIYYEVIDMNSYVEGELITNNIRTDVMKRIFMTKDNTHEIADKINRSLEKIYEKNGK